MGISIGNIMRECNGYTVTYEFSNDIKKYLRGSKYVAEYSLNEDPLDLESVPNSVLIIPLLCNLLPIAWAENQTIYVDELDEDFYYCVKDIQKEYCVFFGKEHFGGGKLDVKHIIKNKNKISTELKTNRSGLFFSGGVDSVYSMLSHIDERPFLQVVWGNMDMNYKKEDGFKKLYEKVSSIANRYQLPLIVIHSNYRDILNRVELNDKYEKILKTRWWMGVQHLVALAGLSAPCNYALGIQVQYLAPTYSEDAVIWHTRYPENVDCIHYFDCKLSQDLAITRQKKVERIANVQKEIHDKLNLSVCYKSQNGENCCACEKCCVTILELMAEGVNPSDFGFNISEEIVERSLRLCLQDKYDVNITPFIIPLQNRVRNNISAIKRLQYGDIVINKFQGE